jgi:hypothetical protein
MNSITFDQIRGPVERIIYIGLGWLVAKGFITSADVANYATLALAVAAAFYGWWQNRPKAVLQSAAAISGTTVVTTPALAKDTPESNIISNTSTNKTIGDAVKVNTEPKVTTP